jgi:putative transposase
MAVSPAGYYAWRARPESTRAAANRALLTDIRQLNRESRQTYGSPRIWHPLRAQGHRVGKHRGARLMRHDGLRAKAITKWHATTQSSHQFQVAANQLNRQFTVAAPNQVWAVDLTYIWTMEGWLYLAVLLDLYSRAVIGWAMGSRLTGELTQQALEMALYRRQPKPSLLHHSDRGSQGEFKWSSQHLRCWPIGASSQIPLQAFSNSACYEAWQ